jgi:hypothetical protein
MDGLPTNELINFGFLRTNESPAADTATVMVVGLPRSGTSMVAAVLQAIGVYIGDRIDNAVFEDTEFAAALAGDSDRLLELIGARNERHRTWGFKRPEAYRRLDQLCRACRNPRVIVTFRDILAIALRNNISMQMEPLALLPRLAEESRKLVKTVGELSAPCLLVSYEKALQHPGEMVAAIAAFCGVSATVEQVAAAVAVIENGRPNYIERARLQYDGHIGRLIAGRLRGWVKARGRDDIRVNVELQLDGRVVQRTRANIYRPDVHKAGHGDGRYGFEFVIDDNVGRDSIVNVRIQNSNILLPTGGLPLSGY